MTLLPVACDLCGRVMDGASCEPWIARDHDDPLPCRDCGVIGPGGIHHGGCCVAVCAMCADQASYCGHARPR